MPDPLKAPLRVVDGAGGCEPGDGARPERGGPSAAPRYDLDIVVAGLRASRDVTHNIRRGGRVRPPPSLRVLGQVVDGLTAALFPSHHGPGDLGSAGFDAFVRGTLNVALGLLEEQVGRTFRFGRDDDASDAGRDAEALAAVEAFAAALPAVRGALVADLRAAGGDAASRSLAEVLLSDAGVSATIAHRLAHVLDGLGATLPALLVSAVAQRRTGIDIHPAVQIGPGFSVAGGASVGAGAVLGARVRLGGGVTLGTRTAAPGEAAPDWAEPPAVEHPRGPVIGDDVTIHPGATVPDHVAVGRGAVVGGGVWLTGNVPPGARVFQAPAGADRPRVDGGRARTNFRSIATRPSARVEGG